MPNADILDAVPPLTERLDDGVDAVPDDAEGVRGSPGDQRIHDDVRGVQVVAKMGRRGLRDDIGSLLRSRHRRSARTRRRPEASGRDLEKTSSLDTVSFGNVRFHVALLVGHAERCARRCSGRA